MEMLTQHSGGPYGRAWAWSTLLNNNIVFVNTWQTQQEAMVEVHQRRQSAFGCPRGMWMISCRLICD